MRLLCRQGTWYGISSLTAELHFLNLNPTFALLLIQLLGRLCDLNIRLHSFFYETFEKSQIFFLQYWPVYIDQLLGQTLIPQTIPKVNSWNSEYPSQIDPPSIPHCTIQRDAIFALSLTQPWLLQRDESWLLQEHPWPLIGQCKLILASDWSK